MKTAHDREPYLLYPQNGRFLAGKTQRIAWMGPLDISLLLPTCCLIGFGIVVGIGLAFMGYERYRIGNCAPVQGVVIQKWMHPTQPTHGSSTTTYSVRYTIAANEHSREATVPWQDYEQMAVGAQVAAIQDPDDPTFSRLTCEWSVRNDFLTMAHGPLEPLAWFALVAVPTACFVAVRWLRKRHLAHRGRPLPGIVVSCRWGRLNLRGGESVCLEYQFTDPDGRQKVAKHTAWRKGFCRHLPRRGTPVKVLYLHDRLYQVL